MLEDDQTTPAADEAPVVKKTTRKAAAKRTTKKAAAAAESPVSSAEAPPEAAAPEAAAEGASAPAPRKRAAAKRTTRKAAAPSAEPVPETEATPESEAGAAESSPEPAPESAPVKTTTRKTAARRTTRKKAVAAPAEEAAPEPAEAATETPADAGAGAAAVLFQAPVVTSTTRRRTRKKVEAAPAADVDPSVDDDEAAADTETGEQPSADEQVARDATTDEQAGEQADEQAGDEATDTDDDANESADEDGEGTPARRRRRRGGRRRRRSGDGAGSADAESGDGDPSDAEDGEAADEGSEEPVSADTAAGEGASEGTSRRRRRRRRAGEEGGDSDDEPNTVTRVRRARTAEDQITAVTGSTRLEAKKQRRREGREAGRRRAPIVSEAEFLARRESVERIMVIRQRKELTQIAVLEDKVLVEHYVARESQTSLIGNVYLGRVQNVLPSMEAAFIDIGKGRNAVLYAGEVNWSALGHKEGTPRKIESVLQSGQTVLVQVTKDPVGHKGARLTSQISLAGRFLVYVPDGTTSGISRKLPDTERNRLKALLKEIVPDTAGVIVRTAAEGASEDELTRDVERLKARWEDIEKKVGGKGGGAQLLYGEPDLTLKVVRDLFTEDFTKLVIEGPDAWETVQGYVSHVAPDLEDRLERFEPAEEGRDAGKDVFATYRIEEQIHKGLDRKVWLPSGGSLIIDRTEAMTVVDVNTGKFTGSGGNLEETVTKNNLEAAEEIVRQLRLRDIGGIIVVDFIDMVLESNRDLVVRRLVECLGRDRTRHQVAEVTSLGLVQMTRKRIGTGLLESFSQNCEHCHGRGVVVNEAPVEPARSDDEGGRRGNGRRNRGRRGGNGTAESGGEQTTPQAPPSPADVAAMARPEKSADEPAEQPEATQVPDPAEVPAEATPEPEVQAEPTEAPVEPEAESEPEPEPESEPGSESEPEAPKVLTRTRRRTATRPAGPPPEAPQPAVVTAADPVVAGESLSDSTSTPEIVVTHVPIKKRGARKR